MTMKYKYTKYLFLNLILLGNFVCGDVSAGTLTNVTITPTDNAVGATTSYTVKFDADTAINNTHFINVLTNNCVPTKPECPRFDGPPPAAFGTVIQPATLTQIVITPNGTSASADVFNGTVATGVTVEFVIPDVTNPTAAGTSETFLIQLTDSSANLIDVSAIIPGINIAGAAGPVVTNPISDQTINEEDGTNAVDLDPGAPVNTNLNFTFTDDDGETLTFTVDPGHDATVVTPAISGNEITLTGLKTGTTDVTIRATDTSMNSVTNTFTVNVIGDLTPATVVPASLLAGDVTTYTVTFDAAADQGANDFIILSGGDVNYALATFVSIAGGSSLTASKDVGASDATQIALNIDSGTISAGDTITVVIGNVTNPGSGGLSSEYVLRTLSGSSNTNGQSTIVGNNFTAANVPTVANIIPGILFNQEDGPIIKTLDPGGIETNLNYTFVDGDGDPMTFTIEPGHDTNIVTATIVNEEIVLTGQGTGQTTVTVKADDLQDGSITTSFNVGVIAELAPVSVAPSSLFTSAVASYVITLTPNVTLDTGDRIRFDTPSGFNQTSSALLSLSGGTIVGSKTGGNNAETVITISSGSVNSGTLVTLELSGIVNPAATGMSGNYEVYTDDGTNNTGLSTVAGSVFEVASIEIFSDGFEDIVLRSAKNTISLINEISSIEGTASSLSDNGDYYQFMNEHLSILYSNKPRSMNEVLQWYESVLLEKSPSVDFDNDGIGNEFDVDPLGLSFKSFN
jgi:hypothetical protein